MKFAARFNDVSRVLLAFLVLNVALLDTMLPFATFVVFTDAFAGLPVAVVVLVGVAAWTASTPGVVAAFAAFRDAHLMRFGEPRATRDARTQQAAGIDAIARPYWSEAEDTRILRPYLRAYMRLLRRTLRASASFGAVIAMLLIACLASLRLLPTVGETVAAAVLAVTAYMVLANVVSLALIVELPRARTTAVLKNGLLLAARRPWPAALSLLVLGVYGYALLQWPFLVLIFGTSLVLFFAYHAADTIICPVRELIIAEETSTSSSTPPAPGLALPEVA